MLTHAQVAIARCVEVAEGLGATHLTTSGAQPRTEPGALDRVTSCVSEVLQRMPAESQIKLTLEPHHGNVLEQPADFQTILDAIPDERVGVCIDTGHFHSSRCRYACGDSVNSVPVSMPCISRTISGLYLSVLVVANSSSSRLSKRSKRSVTKAT